MDSGYREAANLRRSAPRKSHFGWIPLTIAVLICGVLIFLFFDSIVHQRNSFTFDARHFPRVMATPREVNNPTPDSASVAETTPPANPESLPAATNSQPSIVSEPPVPVQADEASPAQPVATDPVEIAQNPTLPASEPEKPPIGMLSSRASTDFFKIKKIECVQKAPHDELRAAWLQLPATRFAWKAKQFVPYIEVQLQTAEQYLVKDTFIRVHFFDADKKLLETVSEPVIAWKSPRLRYSLPVLFPKRKVESAYFALPASVMGKEWTAIAVFGDQHSATSGIYPNTASMFGRNYPDQELVERRVLDVVEREAAIDPVTQVVIETLNPKQPTMTLFMRLPIGTKSGKEAKGVLALCLLANNPTEIRKMLQRCDRDEDGRIYADMKSAFQTLEKLVDASLVENLKNRIAARKPGDDARIVEDMANRAHL